MPEPIGGSTPWPRSTPLERGHIFVKLPIRTMSTARTIWAALLMATCITSSTTANDVPTLKKIYTEQRAKLKQSYIDALKAAPETYLQGLTALESTHQKDGNLDGVLLARKEKLRFTEEKSMPSPLSKDPDIQALQTRFQNTKDEAATQTRERFVELSDKYLARLDQLKRSLTSQNKIQEAITAQDEITRVNADPKLIAARKHMVTQPATSTPTAAEPSNSHDPEITCPGVKIFTGNDRPPATPRFSPTRVGNTAHARNSKLSMTLGTSGKSGNTEERVRITLRPTLRNAFTDMRIVVQYFDAGEVEEVASGFRNNMSRR